MRVVKLFLSGAAVLAFCFAGALALTGCGAGSSAAAPLNRSYVGTQSPGDVWTWTLTDSTFTCTNETAGTNYSGAASLLPNGFYKLTIASTTDTNVAVGAIAYAFEVPGVALIARPVGVNTHPVVATASGTSPTKTTTFNWISIPPANWTLASEAYGTFTGTVSGSTITPTVAAYDLGGNLVSNLTLPAMTLEGGRFLGDSGTTVITPAGVVISDHGSGKGGVVGVKAPAAAVDVADLATRSFRGILFKGGGMSQMVHADPDGAGHLHGVGYSETDPNLMSSDAGAGVTLSFDSQPLPGLIRGTLSNQSGTTPIVLVVNDIGGKFMVFGFSAETGNPPDNFLVMEK